MIFFLIFCLIDDLSISYYYMAMDPYLRARRTRRKSKKSKIIIFLVVVLVLLLGWLIFLRGDKKESSSDSSNQNGGTSQGTEEPPKPELINLQPVVDAWLAKQSADFGIVVYDPANKQVIAQHQPDKKYFAASLYKLYVAYLSLMDFQSGAQNPDEVLTSGFTRKECVDKMIRESHSPCGEAMMADIGQETLRKRVSDRGIKNTIFAGITTTAQDSALMLQYIVEGKDLNATNTAFLKDAMRVQDIKFRKGLATGAPNATWETKVGWNETYNYHDVGIMTLPSGRQYVVAILSLNNGKAAPIADFAATIYQALNR